MSRLERTPQQLDPLGTLVAWQVAPLMAVIVMAYGIFSTVQQQDQLNVPLAVLALLALLAASTLLSLASVPSRSPFGVAAQVVVLVLVVAGDFLFTAATWNASGPVQDDWGQIAVALLLVGMAPLRPPGGILLGGLISGLLVGAIATLPALFQTADHPFLHGLIAATPVIALTFASAGYSSVMVRSILAWQKTARQSIARLEPEVRETAMRMAHQEQVTLLNAGAAPLFAAILERNAITDDDIARAGEIASELRRDAVISLERSWLEEVAGVAGAVDDPERRVDAMPREPRIALSAFLVALARQPRFVPDSLTIVVSTIGSLVQLRLHAQVNAPDRQTRGALVPYLSVLRVVSRAARLRSSGHVVTLQFSYDES